MVTPARGDVHPLTEEFTMSAIMTDTVDAGTRPAEGYALDPARAAERERLDT